MKVYGDPKEERCYAVVDLGNVRKNLQEVKKNLPERMRMIAVVKANSYGIGSVSVSKALRGEVWGYAVASFSEAAELREAGISEPVMVLSTVSEAFFEDCVKLAVRPTFFDVKSLRRFGETAGKLGTTGLYQLAVDTGMTRIGVFPDEEGFETVKEMSLVPHTRAEGIFTHLATMDETDPAKAIRQKERFKAFVLRLQEAGITFEMVHAANSAAIIREAGFSGEEIFNACRYGISLYGAYPSEIPELRSARIRPVLSWYARVTRVATVPAGTEVGYGGTFVTDRTTRIATVSVGYADGYPRSLSSKADVMIRGKRARILGRVCMDQVMTDVTEIPEAEAGDQAILLGKATETGEEITVEELSEKSRRFPYEFFSLLTARVPRIYTDGE